MQSSSLHDDEIAARFTWYPGDISINVTAAATFYSRGQPRDSKGRFGSGGGSVLSTAQVEALQPNRGGWTTKTRAQTVEQLKTTSEGRTLLRTIDSFQSGSAANIPRIRTDIEKYLTDGGTSLQPGRVDSIKTLLGAIKQTNAGERALWRGMVIPGDTTSVLSRYRAGGDLDLSLASFTTDKKIATGFSEKGAGQRVTGTTRTPVVVEWIGTTKHALPIENLSKSRVFATEREWIGAGSYKIATVKTVKRAGKETVVMQIEQVGTW